MIGGARFIGTPRRKSRNNYSGVFNISDLFNSSKWKILGISNIKVGKHIGQGTSGNVHIIQDKYTGKTYALKTVLKKCNYSDNQTRSEIEIHSKLNHPNILKMYGWFEDDKRFYMILEQAKSDLYKTRQIEVITRKKAIQIVLKIISALKYLHSQGFIHRDIKLENILMVGDEPKLADFGYAIQNKPSNILCGTNEYLCYEMMHRKQYTKKVDVWATGVVLYELLYGESPFYNKSRTYLFTKIMRLNYPKKDPIFNSIFQPEKNRISLDDLEKKLRLMLKNASEN